MIDQETYAAAVAYANSHGGGGGGVEKNYNLLDNRPQINNVTLAGNKSASDLGLLGDVEVEGTVLLI